MNKYLLRQFFKTRLLNKQTDNVWWDGFYNVLVLGESSLPDDNPYMPGMEQNLFDEYLNGTKAAESVLKKLSSLNDFKSFLS